MSAKKGRNILILETGFLFQLDNDKYVKSYVIKLLLSPTIIGRIHSLKTTLVGVELRG